MTRDRDEYAQTETVDAEFERTDNKPAPRALKPTYDLPAVIHSDYYVRKPVDIERDLVIVERRLLAEANLAGEDMYYAWGEGDDRVEGGSIILAMALFRNWGNCVVEQLPMQEMHDAYIFTARFIDLETGSTYDRQFRQSKKWTVYGRFDAARKEDIRFNIGQSKAARNVILRVLPEYLKNKAIAMAKEGVRERLEKFIKDKGIVAAQDLVLDALTKEGVPVERILDHYKIANKSALDVDKIVELRGNLRAIQKGEERAEDMYPPTEVEAAAKAARSPEGQRSQQEHERAMSEVAASLGGNGNGRKSPPVTPTTPTVPKPPTVQQPTAPKVETDPLKLLRAELERAANVEELDDLWKGWFNANQLGEAMMMAAETVYGEIFKRISGQNPTLPTTQQQTNGSSHAASTALAEAGEEAKKFALQFANSKTAKGVDRILERAADQGFNELDMMYVRAQHLTRKKELDNAKQD